MFVSVHGFVEQFALLMLIENCVYVPNHGRRAAPKIRSGTTPVNVGSNGEDFLVTRFEVLDVYTCNSLRMMCYYELTKNTERLLRVLTFESTTNLPRDRYFFYFNNFYSFLLNQAGYVTAVIFISVYHGDPEASSVGAFYVAS